MDGAVVRSPRQPLYEGDAMTLDIDPRQPVMEPVGSLEPSHVWVLGLVIDADGRLAGPGKQPYSYLAECECPHDCLRDHENE